MVLGRIALVLYVFIFHFCSAQILYYNFTQRLDHFNSSDQRVFTQRYQVLTNYYQKGGPILLLVGPERGLYPTEIYSSSVFSIFAPKFGGFIVATEHRYYGASLPLGQGPMFTMDALKYLTINQSLADNAAIITYLKQSSLYPELSGAQVIAFGGSYGGFLSALMRIQYPDLISGSLASCTVPYLWNLPNQANLWYNLVSETYLTQWANSTCFDGIAREFSLLAKSINSGNFSFIQNALSLCTPPSQANSYSFFAFLKNAYSNIVEFNYPTPGVTCVPLPFQGICSYIDENIGLPFGATTVAVSFVYNATGTAGTCYEWTKPWTLPAACTVHDSSESAPRITTLRSLPKPSLSVSSTPTYDPWIYQSCTEFIYGAAGGTGIFQIGFEWSLQIAQNSCKELFPGAPWNPYQPLLLPNVSPAYSNVIYSHAGFDPNRGWSPTQNASTSVISISMYCAAHTADLVNMGTNAKPQSCVVDAWAQEVAIMRTWL